MASKEKRITVKNLDQLAEALEKKRQADEQPLAKQETIDEVEQPEEIHNSAEDIIGEHYSDAILEAFTIGCDSEESDRRRTFFYQQADRLADELFDMIGSSVLDMNDDGTPKDANQVRRLIIKHFHNLNGSGEAKAILPILEKEFQLPNHMEQKKTDPSKPEEAKVGGEYKTKALYFSQDGKSAVKIIARLKNAEVKLARYGDKQLMPIDEVKSLLQKEYGLVRLNKPGDAVRSRPLTDDDIIAKQRFYASDESEQWAYIIYVDTEKGNILVEKGEDLMVKESDLANMLEGYSLRENKDTPTVSLAEFKRNYQLKQKYFFKNADGVDQKIWFRIDQVTPAEDGQTVKRVTVSFSVKPDDSAWKNMSLAEFNDRFDVSEYELQAKPDKSTKKKPDSKEGQLEILSQDDFRKKHAGVLEKRFFNARGEWIEVLDEYDEITGKTALVEKLSKAKPHKMPAAESDLAEILSAYPLENSPLHPKEAFRAAFSDFDIKLLDRLLAIDGSGRQLTPLHFDMRKKTTTVAIQEGRAKHKEELSIDELKERLKEYAKEDPKKTKLADDGDQAPQFPNRKEFREEFPSSELYFNSHTLDKKDYFNVVSYDLATGEAKIANGKLSDPKTKSEVVSLEELRRRRKTYKTRKELEQSKQEVRDVIYDVTFQGIYNILINAWTKKNSVTYADIPGEVQNRLRQTAWITLADKFPQVAQKYSAAGKGITLTIAEADLLAEKKELLAPAKKKKAKKVSPDKGGAGALDEEAGRKIGKQSLAEDGQSLAASESSFDQGIDDRDDRHRAIIKALTEGGREYRDFLRHDKVGLAKDITEAERQAEIGREVEDWLRESLREDGDYNAEDTKFIVARIIKNIIDGTKTGESLTQKTEEEKTVTVEQDEDQETRSRMEKFRYLIESFTEGAREYRDFLSHDRLGLLKGVSEVERQAETRREVETWVREGLEDDGRGSQEDREIAVNQIMDNVFGRSREKSRPSAIKEKIKLPLDSEKLEEQTFFYRIDGQGIESLENIPSDEQYINSLEAKKHFVDNLLNAWVKMVQQDFEDGTSNFEAKDTPIVLENLFDSDDPNDIYASLLHYLETKFIPNAAERFNVNPDSMIVYKQMPEFQQLAQDWIDQKKQVSK